MKNISQMLDKGLAYATVYLHGLDPEKFSRFITHSFSNKTQILPNPKGDSFSSSVVVFLAGDNDTICLCTQPPGVMEWRRKTHLSSTIKSIEFNPRKGPHGEKGYPYGSINEEMFKSKEFVNELKKAQKTPVLITTFPDDTTRKKAKSIAINMIQSADPTLINTKSYFHDMKDVFHYLTCPSYIVRNELDITLAVKELSKYKKGVWVKYNGSGGDTVIFVPVLTKKTLRDTIIRIKNIILNSFIHAGFSRKERNEIIDPDSLIPASGIVVEADVRNFGKVTLNGSNTVLTDITGQTKVYGLYSQITNRGIFYGSSNLVNDYQLREIKEILEENAKNVARLAINIRYFGVHGQDFFVVLTNQNKLTIYNTELNGRIPNSGIAHMAMKQAGVKHFLMLNIKRKNKTCNTLDEFEKLVTFDGMNYLNNNPKEGAIWPMAFKARWRKEEKYILEEDSDKVRILILADDPKRIENIKAKIITRCIFI